ncbi:hypothetical protein RB195_012555 [Necator americanus]
MSNKDTKDLLFESLASEESDTLFYTFRKATFKNWCFDKKNSPCSSNALSRAGFFFSGSRSEPAAATCAYCLKEMIFEENDDPWEEHKSHAKMCSFVELGKLDEKEWTVRDFIYLLSGRIAAEQRQNVIQEIKDFEAASTEIETMAIKALNSLK